MSSGDFRWPSGRRFAFTVFDDTDWTTVQNGRPVYDMLTDLGFRVTKSVWLDDPGPNRTVGGSTCDDPDYLRWVIGLQSAGHEIGYHNASDRSSTRERTIAALDRFEALFGHPPRCGADHGGNAEALYGGAGRLSGWRSAVYRAAQRRAQPTRPEFSGHDPHSPYFWGDVCRDRVDYWRRFSFARTDISRVGPVLHHDPLRPWVNAWFNASHGPRRASFVDRLDRDRLDELESDGGLCIMYTHFGVDFVDDRNRPHRDLVRALSALAERDGWFAPVADILDHVASSHGVAALDRRGRARLERGWIIDRLRDRAPIGPSVPTHVQDGP